MLQRTFFENLYYQFNIASISNSDFNSETGPFRLMTPVYYFIGCDQRIRNYYYYIISVKSF